MLEFYDIEQNTEEWLQMRAGRLTSSKMGVIMANNGKAFGEPAKKYAVDIAIEQITGKPVSSGYQNEHMQRGHEQEPMARARYENETFIEVSNGGFFASEFVGCSPDGRVGANGAIEIKSVIPSVHFYNIKRQGLDPQYKWQCIANLKFMGVEWLDFVSYCADFPDDKKIFIHRIYADSEYVEKLFLEICLRVSEFKKLVDKSKKLILESDYQNFS